MKKYLIILLSINSLFSITTLGENSCIQSKDNRNIYRNNYTYPESVQGDNFIVHFTSSDVDSQNVNGIWFNLQSNASYAQSILDHTEAALVKYLNDGWENVPPDCDDSITDLDCPDHCINYGGNSLYDIYISNDGVGMVVPENPYAVEPYTGGYTSFMKISTLLNEYESLPTWSYHVIAHELHHSIQLRYGYSVSGTPGNYMYNGWLFEQSATYMENVIYPESIHLRTMLGNCNVVTPLTFPELNIDYPAEIYPYRSALWQKFLVESIGDSSIIKNIWENYGLQYATGNIVSLFPIYDNAVGEVTGNNMDLSDAYSDYAEWRYFTGDRSIPGMHFNESTAYCESTTMDFENSFYISSDKGASRYINLPSDNINISIYSDYLNEINFSLLMIDENNEFDIINLSSENDISFNISDNTSNVLFVNSIYSDIDSNDLNFTLSVNDNFNLGDFNYDNSVDVIDVIILVNYILSSATVELEGGDINGDNEINILDVTFLINIILN